MDEPLRLIDLIPRRLTTFAAWLLVGATVIVVLEVFYTWMPELAPTTSDGRVAALDLDGEGSLAAWFSSVILLLASMTALLVYTVRRHKTDDYQGYYRIWLWASMCWLLMSIDETSSLHEGFKNMMVLVTGTAIFGDGSIWWVLPYFFLLGAVGSRLLVDMWDCRLSSASLMGVAGCYVLAVVIQLQWVLPESGARGVMFEEGAEMAGNVLLLLAMGLHARYVVLDAEGLLPQVGADVVAREERASETGAELRWDQGDDAAEEFLPEPPESDSSEVDEWVKVDSAHGPPQPVLKRSVSAPRPAPKAAETSVRRKLTKAERKALRKRLARDRLERERKQRGNWGKAAG
ncbi:MAG: hypothetical protein JXB62_17015 [Pirellulales bacterium]|nr:hypothetical protein [Pirellulales bacterium]